MESIMRQTGSQTSPAREQVVKSLTNFYWYYNLANVWCASSCWANNLNEWYGQLFNPVMPEHGVLGTLSKFIIYYCIWFDLMVHLEHGLSLVLQISSAFNGTYWILNSIDLNWLYGAGHPDWRTCFSPLYIYSNLFPLITGKFSLMASRLNSAQCARKCSRADENVSGWCDVKWVIRWIFDY